MCRGIDIATGGITKNIQVIHTGAPVVRKLGLSSWVQGAGTVGSGHAERQNKNLARGG